MKTAVAQLIDKIENDAMSNYSHEQVLEMLSDCQVRNDLEIKLTYLHGKISATKNENVDSDQYFTQTFN
jgi:hypothetical protein